MTTRRTVLGGGLTAMAGLALGGCIPRDTSEAGRLEAQFRLIEVATGGLVVRRLANDPLLRGISVLAVDEVHGKLYWGESGILHDVIRWADC